MMQKRLGYEMQGFGYGPGGCGREPQGLSDKPQGYEQQWFGCACTSIRLRIRVAIWFSAIFSAFLRRTYYFTSPETVFAAKKPHVVGSRRHLPDLL